jgi:hypothetical protein
MSSWPLFLPQLVLPRNGCKFILFIVSILLFTLLGSQLTSWMPASSLQLSFDFDLDFY